jgi:DNA-directed RNA polymerase specialized sigma24 family protein
MGRKKVCGTRPTQTIECRLITEVSVAHATQVMNGSTAYTTSDDFCRIFSEEMDDLYSLALLLTADTEKAEQCFVAGIGDCVEGNAVFREWARSWARRAIVQQAIRATMPTEGRPDAAATLEGLNAGMMAVIQLDTLERFVYVMSVLEGFSQQDCSILLGVPRQSVVNARSRAIAQLASAAEAGITPGVDLQTAYAPASN